MVLTEPEIGPSWADFPLTLKLRLGQTFEVRQRPQAGEKDLHNAIWCLGLDLEVGSSGMVEILVEELVGLG